MKTVIAFLVLFIIYSSVIAFMDTNPKDHRGIIWALALILTQQSLTVTIIKPKKDDKSNRD